MQKRQNSGTSRIKKGTSITNEEILKRLSVVSSRMKYAASLGETYDGDRDLYEALGYKTNLEYKDYYNKFKRGDIAKVIISKPVNAVWGNPPALSEGEKDVVNTDENSLKNQWLRFIKKYNLYSQLMRLDKLLGLGRFAVLLFGFDDTEDFSQPLSVDDNPNLLYIQPYGEDHTTINDLESSTANPRYGLPLTYELQLPAVRISNTEQRGKSIRVHHSRVLHVIEDPLENPVYGTPRLEALFNRLEDLQKLLGGSAEMFWRGARPGYAAQADADAGFGAIDADAMREQFDEFEHNLRRWLTVQGVDINPLAPQVESPKDHIDAQIMMISIVTGIPKRILTGSERGELASTQDEKVWNALIKDRMITFGEPQILRPLIDKLISCGVLTTEEENYQLTWPKMSAMGEKEKADVIKTRSQAIREYLSTAGADMLVPPEVWLRDEFGYNEDQIKQIQDIVGQIVKDEANDDELESVLEEMEDA